MTISNECTIVSEEHKVIQLINNMDKLIQEMDEQYWVDDLYERKAKKERLQTYITRLITPSMLALAMKYIYRIENDIEKCHIFCTSSAGHQIQEEIYNVFDMTLPTSHREVISNMIHNAFNAWSRLPSTVSELKRIQSVFEIKQRRAEREFQEKRKNEIKLQKQKIRAAEKQSVKLDRMLQKIAKTDKNSSEYLKLESKILLLSERLNIPTALAVPTKTTSDQQS